MAASFQTAHDGAHIIVVGNGLRRVNAPAGKTVLTAQLAAALTALGYAVGTLDAATPDEALSLFIHNRREHGLPVPAHKRLLLDDTMDAAAQTHRLRLAVTELGTACDFILIDTPSGDHPLSAALTGYADTLITPLRPQPAHINSLAILKNNTNRFEKAAPYSEMVEGESLRKLDRGSAPLQWLVLRSRYTNSALKKKRQDIDLLDKLSGDLGFQPGNGLSERPFYNDLFAQGLTALDTPQSPDLSLPLLAARQEVRSILHTLLPEQAAQKVS